jgi:GDPmannose 4,6-dehydratase
MWLMLQQEKPGDYVIGTGEAHTVREFLQEAFSYVGLDWQQYVRISPAYFRPTEVDFLMADCSKACKELGWMPKIQFKELVQIMVDADLESQGLDSPGKGRLIVEEKFKNWHYWPNQIDNPRK